MAKFLVKKWAICIVVLALILMMLGIPVLPGSKAALSGVKDTISDSDLGVDANHTIQFTIGTALSASSTITLKFDDAGDAFDLTGISNLANEDFDIATTSDFYVRTTGGCTGIYNEFEITSVNTSTDEIVFTLCWGSNDLPVNTTTTIEIGTNATFDGTGDTQINNPSTAGSYLIKIETRDSLGTLLEEAEAAVAIIEDVVVTATVSATLTFTISGVESGTSTNGAFTDVTTNATSVPFGTLPVNSSTTAAQDLAVATNASDGFTVTVFQDQNLTSAAGDDIDCFQDGTCIDYTSAIAWTPPSGTLGSENTYGHFGLTSEDDSLGTNCANDYYGTDLWAGFSGTAQVEVMCHTGPADGATSNIGATRVGYTIEISALQEAGDYTNTLTYIATPTY